MLMLWTEVLKGRKIQKIRIKARKMYRARSNEMPGNIAEES